MISRLRAAAVVLALASTAAVWVAGADDVPVCDQSAPRFRAPIELGAIGKGYEPGIEIDAGGTVFVTAHKLSLAKEEAGAETRLSSFLWRSKDNGLTFEEVPSPAGLARYPWAFEGDLAVDAQDRLYYVDTWAGDEHLYRYSNHGDTLDFYRPIVPTWNGIDDRPWLAAHHDVVYYLFNSVNPIARQTVHRSLDGGLTWDVGTAFPNSLWGFIDADPNSDQVYAVVNEYDSPTQGSVTVEANRLAAWVSSDRGATWTRHEIAPYEFGYQTTNDHDDAYPLVAVSPVDSDGDGDASVYALWTDDGRKLILARSEDRGATWEVHDVTPFAGKYSYPWLTVGPTGDVGISFEADPAASLGSANHIYAMVWRPTSDCLLEAGNPDSMCTGPSRLFARVSTRTITSYASQADFFQLEMSADNAINVPWTGGGNRITYTRQIDGPNMRGTPSCGLVGT